MTELISHETFLPHLDKEFRVKGGRHVLKLSRVDTMPKIDGMPRQPFTLIFSGPPGDLLPEGQRTFEVDGGAAFDLYVIPVHTPQLGRQDYQAVFN
jgi:hypothetical protein